MYYYNGITIDETRIQIDSCDTYLTDVVGVYDNADYVMIISRPSTRLIKSNPSKYKNTKYMSFVNKHNKKEVFETIYTDILPGKVFICDDIICTLGVNRLYNIYKFKESPAMYFMHYFGYMILDKNTLAIDSTAVIEISPNMRSPDYTKNHLLDDVKHVLNEYASRPDVLLKERQFHRKKCSCAEGFYDISILID